ncbi:MAG: HU family DNA-binding protein [Bacteroidaceae bacterium]|nr:HU family DNA-binding protein [Bacteroidaceae bacterium]
MSLLYEFYRNPQSDENEKRKYHPRVITTGRVDTEQLARDIQQSCSLTRSDVKGMLAALADKMAQYLSEGKRVYLEDIGYFKVNLECNQEITEIDDKGVGKVSFKSISFRADERLKKIMKRTKIHRSNLKPHSMPLTNEEIEAKLTEHFATNPAITRRQFQFLCQILKPTACRIIKRLVEEGKLKNIASSRSPVYMPVEGHYGK